MEENGGEKFHQTPTIDPLAALRGFLRRYRDRIDFSGGPDACWIWSGASGRDGYGQVTCRQKFFGAHRLAYLAAYRRLPRGAVIRHTCDTPSCVNPRHLKAGTQADNVRDRGERGRTARGERNGLAKLTEADVLAIRAEYSPGDAPALAERYGVAARTIRGVATGATWKHVPQTPESGAP